MPKTDPFSGNTIMSVVQPLPPSQKSKVVLWIHGLGGQKTSWSNAYRASEEPIFNTTGFSARYLSGTKADYLAESESLKGAANECLKQLNNHWHSDTANHLPIESSIIVGHSQGGIVARRMQYDAYCDPGRNGVNKKFHGIATFGAPHQGAYILDHYQDLFGIAAKTCEVITNAKTARIATLANGIMQIFTDSFSFEQRVGMACSNIGYRILPQLTGSLTEPLTEEYKIGSPFLDTLAQCQTTSVERVAFYGVEKPDNLFWRTASYLIHEPNSDTVWGSNDDFHALRSIAKPLNVKAMEEIAALSTQIDSLKSVSIKLLPSITPIVRVFYVPWYLAKKKANVQRIDFLVIEKNKQQTLINHLDQINDQWKVSIGALSFQQNSSGICYCFNEKTSQTTKTFNNSPGNCTGSSLFDSCYETIIYSLSRSEKESDGVVLVESASSFPGQTQLPQRLDGSSHMQMRNNLPLKDALNDLYEGDYGSAFKAPKK